RPARAERTDAKADDRQPAWTGRSPGRVLSAWRRLRIWIGFRRAHRRRRSRLPGVARRLFLEWCRRYLLLGGSCPRFLRVVHVAIIIATTTASLPKLDAQHDIRGNQPLRYEPRICAGAIRSLLLMLTGITLLVMAAMPQVSNWPLADVAM